MAWDCVHTLKFVLLLSGISQRCQISWRRKATFFGDRPSLTVATVYSVLANVYAVPFASPMKTMLEQALILLPFIARFKAEYYGDDTAQ